MATLTQANRELFKRSPDEYCLSLNDMAERLRARKESSFDRWEAPASVRTQLDGGLKITAGNDGFWLNDWSFSQLCRMAGVAKDTVNKLSATTAHQVFQETILGEGKKPLQLFVEENTVRSIHGAAYTRLWDMEVMNLVREYAVDFTPPQKGFNGATGLYVGEQDMFCFLIDPKGWIDINGEAFAPGFFVANSEVGKRSLSCQAFWLQAVCQNHLIWDAVEVVDFKRKHTSNVRDGLKEIGRIIEGLVKKRDERKDAFAKNIAKAMETELGKDAEEVLKQLTKNGIPRAAATKALEIAREKGRFTVFCLVDALTQMAREIQFAGDRYEADVQASSLLQLAS